MLDTAHPKKSGRCPVKIRVTYKRTRWYYSTGKDLTQEEWNILPTSKVRAIVSIRKDIESSYQIVRTAVEELATAGGFTLEALNVRLKGATSDTINTAFRARMEALNKAQQIGNMLIYDNVLKGLERFAGPRIHFESITVSWLEKYALFLREEGKSQTTIAIHLRTLRAILNIAKQQGIIREAQYPFGRGAGQYRIQAGTGRKMALTLEQIGQIARYDDGRQTTARYRDYWLFLYLCNGINVADFVRLRYRDIVNGEIYFIRQKTEHTLRTLRDIRVVLTPPMQEIINRWGNPKRPDAFIFPILTGREDAMTTKNRTKDMTHSINKRMKEVGEQLGIGECRRRIVIDIKGAL